LFEETQLQVCATAGSTDESCDWLSHSPLSRAAEGPEPAESVCRGHFGRSKSDDSGSEQVEEFFSFFLFFFFSLVCSFDHLDLNDLSEVEKVLDDVEIPATFEISFEGVKILPNAKHPREIVSRIHFGKKQLQRTYKFVEKHHLLQKYAQNRHYVPLLKLAHFSDIKPPLMKKEDILPLYFIEQIHKFRPDKIILFDKDNKKSIYEKMI
jgi:hypothetical protein